MSEAVGYGVRGGSRNAGEAYKLAKVLNQHFYKLLSIHRLGGGTYNARARGFELRGVEAERS